MSQNDSVPDTVINRKYIAAGAVFCVAAAAFFLFSRPLQIDEAEFYQTSWLMSQGKCIYRDFFQHHNPLAYWLYIPFIKAVPHEVTPNTLFLLRLPNLFVMFLTLACLFRLFCKIFTPAVAMLGIFFLATWPTYLTASIFIRPDSLMNFCIILGLYVICPDNSFGAGTGRWLFCGLLMGMAFCLLQKAIPFAGVLFLILLERVCLKKETWKTIPAFLCGMMLIGGVFILMVCKFYGWNIYETCCWKFNMVLPQHDIFGARRVFTEWAYIMLYAFIPLWGLLGIFMAIRRGIAREFAFFALVGGYASFIFSPFCLHQYAVFMMISSAPFAAMAVLAVYSKYGRKFLMAFIVVSVLFMSLYFYKTADKFSINRNQWAIQKKINAVQPEKQCILASFFYLFSELPDYIWFNWNYTLPAWRMVEPSDPRYHAKDYIEIVRLHRPVLIETAFTATPAEELKKAGYRKPASRYKFVTSLWYNPDIISLED
ncbi:MAG TPA: glycosyltransferase family 39 protein [Phycisphaerae bacterium]|nr:glycosyltransferase family 39 protein [Phycisphaerae bacterium]